MTKSEAWKYVLSARQMMGYQFRRQRPVLKYVADFMCKELSLIIEVDEITHNDPEAVAKDQVRDEKLKEAGFHVLRFASGEILNEISAVSEAIVEWINLNAK